MIEVLNEKIKLSKVSNMTAIHTDINNDPPILDKFDLIYTSMALHHIKDIETTLNTLYNLLSKSGHLCIVDLVKDDGSFHKDESDFDGHNGFDQNELALLLNKIGFHDVSSKVIYNDLKDVSGVKSKYSLFLMKASHC